MTTLDIGLDSSVLAGRMRSFDRRSYARRPMVRVQPRGISDVVVSAKTHEGTSAPQVVYKTKTAHAPAPSVVRKPQSSIVVARQYAGKSQKKKHVRIPRLHVGSSTLLTGAAVMLLIVGVGAAYRGWRTNDKVVAQVRAVTTNRAQDNDSGAPDESKPSDAVYGAYSVVPDLPRYLRIPRLGVNAMVKRQTIDKTGALAAPGNVHVAGWYDGSSKPGEGGAVLMDGHVAGPTTHGVFYNLKSLKAGDTIEVERGDGKKFNYKVVKTESKKADQVDMSAALLSAEVGKPGLNLITCTGKITNQEYSDRLVVYAVQI